MRRHAKILFAVAALTSFLALAPSALAVKTVDRFIGRPGGGSGVTGSAAVGEVFGFPRDVAVNEAGIGGAAAGDVYVVDAVNNRIAVYSSSGFFKFAFGRDVIAPGVPGDLGEAFEKCTVAADCKGGAEGSLGGEFRFPQGIAIDQATGAVYVRDSRNTSTSSSSNLRVQQFSATGAFVRAWGWDVVQAGGSGDTDPVNGLEICSVASQCKAGSAGGGAGQFGVNGVAGTGIAVAPAGSPSAGHVFVADPANGRIEEFDSALAPANLYVRSFGTAGTGKGQFNTSMPQHVAVDSAGVVYGTDTSGNGRIDRFDSAAAAMEPIAVPPLLSGGTSVLSTQGLEVDPDSDGGGADVDRLYVLRNPSSGNTVVQQFDEPGKAIPPAAVSATHGPTEFGTSSVNGLGLNTALGATGTLYVATEAGTACADVCAGVFALDDDGTGGIAATIASASIVNATSATLNGSIDPGSGLVRYHFEYSSDGSTWAPTADTQIGGAAPQPVSTGVTGLSPNTLYRVRLVATKVLSLTSSVSETSDEALFQTATAAPVVETRPVHAFDDTSAWLVADVDPSGQSTTYRFEWGLTTGYGRTAPVPNGQAGSGNATHPFLVEINGLKPSTTYHYRIVAENDTGAATGDDIAFTTRPAFGGFEDRAYEQVTPVRKRSDINRDFTQEQIPGPASASGNAKVFYHIGALENSIWGQADKPDYFVAYRSPTRWTTRPISPEPPVPPSGTPRPIGFLDPDFSTQIVNAALQPLVGVGPQGIYLQNSFTGTLDIIASGDESGAEGVSGWIAESGHGFAFMRSAQYTVDAPVGNSKVYLWDGNQIQLVSIAPGGEPFASEATLGSGAFGNTFPSYSYQNTVSDDGRFVYFSNGSPELIYRRDLETATTVLASPSQRTPADPLGPVDRIYLDATVDQGPDGPAAVFFGSKERLTNQATATNATSPNIDFGDLYRYEVNSDTLTNISAEIDDPAGARVLGLLGKSDDGKWVYYVAKGQVLAGEGVPDRPNMYLWHDDGSVAGETRLLGTLANENCTALLVNSNTQIGPLNLGDGCNYTMTDGLPRAHSARVSKDGLSLLIQSQAQLTGYPNQGFSELYLYEANANGGSGAMTCVSCNPDGASAHANTVATTSGGPSVGQDQVRMLSSDGGRVFFTSPESLAVGDTNSYRDVYEWQAGHLRLISTGEAEEDALFDGASRSGDDVFFTTREQLVGQDDDQLRDLYDARVGGGLASQNPPPAGIPCTGSACKPPASPSPGSPVTRNASSNENYVFPFEVAPLNARARRAFAERGRVSIRIAVHSEGRLEVRALRGKQVLASFSRAVPGDSTVDVPLRLNAKATQMLAKQGHLRLRLEVRFGGESETSTVDLRRVK